MGGTRQTSIVGQALNDTTMKKNHLDSMDGDASMDQGSNKPEDPNYNDMPPEFIPVFAAPSFIQSACENHTWD